MVSRKTSQPNKSTIDNIVSELEQLERRLGKKPVVGVSGEFSEPVRSALEDRGYNCAKEGDYNVSTDAQDLENYSETITEHFPQNHKYQPQGF